MGTIEQWETKTPSEWKEELSVRKDTLREFLVETNGVLFGRAYIASEEISHIERLIERIETLSDTATGKMRWELNGWLNMSFHRLDLLVSLMKNEEIE